VIPADFKVVSATCTFIPLSLFKVHQLTTPASPHHLAFSRAVHRELGPIINMVPKRSADTSDGTLLSPIRLPTRVKWFGRQRDRMDQGGNPIPAAFDEERALSMSNRSTSTLKLWDRESAEQLSPETAYEPDPAANLSMLGGIMISQEVTVNVLDVGRDSSRASDRRSGRRAATRDRQNAKIEESIEMCGLHGTKSMRVANVEVERYDELVTFVDELYALCVEVR
jgi:hypothetical protein